MRLTIVNSHSHKQARARFNKITPNRWFWKIHLIFAWLLSRRQETVLRLAAFSVGTGGLEVCRERRESHLQLLRATWDVKTWPNIRLLQKDHKNDWKIIFYQFLLHELAARQEFPKALLPCRQCRVRATSTRGELVLVLPAPKDSGLGCKPGNLSFKGILALHPVTIALLLSTSMGQRRLGCQN